MSVTIVQGRVSAYHTTHAEYLLRAGNGEHFGPESDLLGKRWLQCVDDVIVAQALADTARLGASASSRALQAYTHTHTHTL